MPTRLEIHNLLIDLGNIDEVKPGKLIGENLAGIDIDQFYGFEHPILARKRRARLQLLPATILGNANLGLGGTIILLKSTKNALISKNKSARGFYILGMLFSSTGTISATLSVYFQKSGLSKSALLGDTFGGICLEIGDYINTVGERIETKQKSFKFKRSPRTKINNGYKGVAFVPGYYRNNSLQKLNLNIPYEKIFAIGSTVLTIYTYYKLIILIYNYLNLKFYRKENYSQQIHSTSKFLVYSLLNKRIYRVYCAALNF